MGTKTLIKVILSFVALLLWNSIFEGFTKLTVIPLKMKMHFFLPKASDTMPDETAPMSMPTNIQVWIAAFRLASPQIRLHYQRKK